jgi:hypothetical protein
MGRVGGVGGERDGDGVGGVGDDGSYLLELELRLGREGEREREKERERRVEAGRCVELRTDGLGTGQRERERVIPCEKMEWSTSRFPVKTSIHLVAC